MNINFLNRNWNSSLYEKNKKNIEFKSLEENNKNQEFKFSLIKIKEKNNNKIFQPNKRSSLNKNTNLIFSNEEIKKYIKDNNINNTYKESEFFLRKIENGKSASTNKKLSEALNILNINKHFDKVSILKQKKELKEESTNTYIKDDDNIKYYGVDTPRLTSIDSSKNKIIINNEEKNKAQPISSTSKMNNYIYFNENAKIYNNRNSKNKFSPNFNHVNNISINNNINFSHEVNKNNIKYYFDLYNFHLIQSIIQNRSNFFNLKNKNFSAKTTKYEPYKNITFLLNNKKNSQNNGISLRELYRNLNNDSYSINSFKIKHIQKNKLKKKIKKIITKKSNDNNYNATNLFDVNYNNNLINSRFNLDNFFRNKNRKRINNFHTTHYTKRFSNIINYKNFTDKTAPYGNKNYFKTNINFHRNILKQKYNHTKDDILEQGLSNSSIKIKFTPRKKLNKISK